MNLKFLATFVSTLLFFERASSQANSTATQTSSCKPQILAHFGITGLSTPTKINSPICPSVGLSCCSLDHINQLATQWTKGGKQKSIQDYFDFVLNTYKSLFNTITDSSKLASRVFLKVQNRTSSNCKILARRLLYFQPETVLPLLLTQIQKMLAFFQNTQKGLICASCEFRSHRFFDITANNVTLSYRFCRDIVTNSLHVLVYYYSHFQRLLAIAARFVNHCSFNGDFTDKPFPAELALPRKKERADAVENCKAYRNEINWFSACERLCNSFSLTDFPLFFAPQMNALSAFNVTFSSILNGTLFREANPIPVNVTANTTSPRPSSSQTLLRVLQAVNNSTTNVTSANATANQTQAAVATQNFTVDFQKPVLSPKASSAQYDLKSLKPSFAIEGLSLSDFGDASFPETLKLKKKMMLVKKKVLKRELKKARLVESLGALLLVLLAFF